MSLVVLAAGGDTFVPPKASDFWQPLIGDGSFAITRAMIVMVLVVAGLVIWTLMATRRMTVVPSKGQWMFESIYGLVRNGVAKDMMGEKNMRPYLPLLFALFMVILVNNLMGIIPPVQFPTMSRIGFPIGLTLIVYLVYLGVGFKRRGFVGYFKGLVPPNVPGFVVPLLFILEIITYFFTRPLTLALRLFGNMFAGHILLVLMALGGEFLLLHGDGLLRLTSIGPLAMFFVMTAFELLVQFLQAYVFTLLAAFYIADSLSDHH